MFSQSLECFSSLVEEKKVSKLLDNMKQEL